MFLASSSLLSLPFFLAGGLKLVYDALLYRSFSTMKRRRKANEIIVAACLETAPVLAARNFFPFIRPSFQVLLPQ